jgi:hypothetical protein
MQWQFNFLFPICVSFISFSCLILCLKVPVLHWLKAMRRHLCLVSDLTRNISSFQYDAGCELVTHNFIMLRCDPFMCVLGFYDEGMFSFVKCFCASIKWSYGILPHSVDMMHCVYWCSYAEHSCIMGNDLFNVIYTLFVSILLIMSVSMFIGDIGQKISFLLYLFFFCIQVMQASLNIFGRLPLPFTLGKSGVSSALNAW